MVDIKLGGDDYTVAPSKIMCLLRNYADHAREMSNVVPARPRFFLKPPSSLIGDGGDVVIPAGVDNLHHEVELAVIIGRRGKNIPEEEAMGHIKGFALMLDITARDLQSEAKEKGLPWSEAKGYDTFAPIGPTALPPEDYDHTGRRIWLTVNGETRQDGNTDRMVFSPGVLISSISGVMTLNEDDIIMMGTPAGVGPLLDGDLVEAGIDGLCRMKVRVASEDRISTD